MALVSFLTTFILAGTSGEAFLYVGRDDVKLGEVCGTDPTFKHPWQAVIRGTECGGVLIDSKHILTPAHCIVKATPNFSVDLGPLAHPVSRRAAFKRIHPLFLNHSSLNADIAVVGLEDPVSFSDVINPICMPIGVPDSVTLTRFDFNGTTDEFQANLSQACGPGVEVCAGKKICRRQSAGVMTAVDAERRHVIGLASWGRHHDCNGEDGFVGIQRHSDWIKAVIAEKSTGKACTRDSSRRILLLGRTGVGKSTLGNQLLGFDPRADDAPFDVGDTLNSETANISFKVGPWLGRGECVTVIDTPGTLDSEGRDYEHAVRMVDIMKNESVDVILILLSGQQLRFDQSVLELLKLYESIYSKNMWKHVMLETTFWSHDPRSIRHRKSRQNMTEERRHAAINEKLKETFDLEFDIPTVFVDPVLPMFNTDYDDLDEYEVEMFENQTQVIWDFAKSKAPFQCEGNCQAPGGYFTGQPWVTPTRAARRKGESVELTCRVWKGWDQNAFGNVTWKLNGNFVYVQNSDGNGTSFSATSHIKVVNSIEDDYGFVGVSRLTIPRLEADLGGSYSCNNGLENDDTNVAEVLLMVDAEWSTWSSWSTCSVSCVHESNPNPGIARRTRTCGPIPQNGGTYRCDPSGETDTVQCAGTVGTPLRFCPVNHYFTPWGGWGGCDAGSCNNWRGRRRGHRTRYRTCVEARHGGVPCPPGGTVETTGCSKKCGWKKWKFW